MNPREASDYLEEAHKISVLPGTVTKWLKLGYVDGEKDGGRWLVSKEAIDDAVDSRSVPPKSGRRPRLSRKQKKQIRDMYDKKDWTLKQLAHHFNVSESYVSLLVRGLR